MQQNKQANEQNMADPGHTGTTSIATDEMVVDIPTRRSIATTDLVIICEDESENDMLLSSSGYFSNSVTTIDTSSRRSHSSNRSDSCITVGGVGGDHHHHHHQSTSSSSFRSIEPTSKLRTSKESIEQLNSLTINKLNFREINNSRKLWGREKEVDLLHSKLNDFCLKQQQQQEESNNNNIDNNPNPPVPVRQLIWIYGHSGCGKTALANCLRKQPILINRQWEGGGGGKGGGLFVSGKFDFSLQNEPYSGFVSAFGAICAEILSSSSSSPSSSPSDHQDQDHQDIRNKIREELGNELLNTLMQIIPPLAEVWDANNDQQVIISETAAQAQAAVSADTTTTTTTSTTTTTTTTDNKKDKQQQQQQSSSSSSSSSTEESKNRFTFSVKTFLKVVTTFYSPLIIFLDDLQWADTCSLDLLEALMGDRDSPTFILLGTFRSNEVDSETHPLAKTKRDLELLAKSKTQHQQQQQQQQRRLDVTDISVGNVDLPAVHGVIRSLLSIDDDKSTTRTLGLANLCFRKTNGNVFFLLQYMVSLHQMELIRYNFGRFTWDWDEDTIAKQTEATENVVDLLQEKMLQLNETQREILPLMACFGSSFSPDLLATVWDRRFQMKEGNTTTEIITDGDATTTTAAAATILNDALSLFAAEGYVETIDKNLRWVHDRIQEAAASLIPEESRPAFRRQVGEILLASLDDHERQNALFVIVELLNQSSDPNQSTTELLGEASLNLQAAERAISFSAFRTAATYAGKGIRLLELTGDTFWSDHYDLALDLYSLGARAEGSLGNIETMEEYCDAVLSQTRQPVEDKFCVYDVLADSLANRGKVQDAADVLLGVLDKYRCRFPPRGSISLAGGILWNLIKIKSSLKASLFDKLDEMTDVTRATLMKFLNKLITYFYMMGDDRLALFVFRMLNWTLKYGYCVYSTVAIGFTGVILVGALNDLQSADICRRLTVLLTDKLDLGVSKSRVNLILHGFVQHWSLPIADSIKPLQHGYELGLKCGDTESAAWNIHHFCLFRLFTGVALSSLEVDLRAYSAQMEDLQRQTPHSHSSMVLKTILNLQGQAKGSYIVLDGDNDVMTEGGMQEFVLSVQRVQIAILYCYLGAHEQLAELTIEVGFDYGGKVFPGTIYQVTDIYTKGVSCFAAARDESSKGKSRKFAKLGRKCLDRLRLWSKNGNVNIQHHLKLVEAEYAAFRGQNEKALGLYMTALRYAGRCGFQQDAGLVSERLCEFHLTNAKDSEEARHWLREALRYYSGWGASAKLELLREKHSSLEPAPVPEVMAVP